MLENLDYDLPGPPIGEQPWRKGLMIGL
jgi:hypothetical protein